MNRATTTDMAISTALILTVAVPVGYVFSPLAGGLAGLAFANAVCALVWKVRGESALRGIKPSSTYEWEDTE